MLLTIPCWRVEGSWPQWVTGCILKTKQCRKTRVINICSGTVNELSSDGIAPLHKPFAKPYKGKQFLFKSSWQWLHMAIVLWPSLSRDTASVAMRMPSVRIIWGCKVGGTRRCQFGMSCRMHSMHCAFLQHLLHTPQMMVCSASFEVALRNDLKVFLYSESEAMQRQLAVEVSAAAAELRASRMAVVLEAWTSLTRISCNHHASLLILNCCWCKTLRIWALFSDCHSMCRECGGCKKTLLLHSHSLWNMSHFIFRTHNWFTTLLSQCRTQGKSRS